jgi:hypothetical protein
MFRNGLVLSIYEGRGGFVDLLYTTNLLMLFVINQYVERVQNGTVNFFTCTQMSVVSTRF